MATDHSHTTARGARARANGIRAQISRQEMDIADCVMVSPAEDKVVMTFVRKGEHVSPGQRIAMFHDPNEIWVEANVKEIDVGVLKPGMMVEVDIGLRNH